MAEARKGSTEPKEFLRRGQRG